MLCFIVAVYFTCLLVLSSSALPSPASPVLADRTYPYFPDTPPSCPICAANYDGINSCAQAAPVLANFSEVLFNPGAFLDVIKCACTDTFQSAFPQCVDCFEKTNQTGWLDTPDLPSVVSGMRNVCGFASSILGNVSDSNGETTPSSSATATATANSGPRAAEHWQPVGGALALPTIALGIASFSALLL
ncbi:hypothetical protein FA95DRAFT_1485398 [Auriscalpium vulgare]|uniref:Uncharacterized protein n=1 Tax=Auriscalpium vulgare TaxID=40419 RepID=A0ACB8S6F1_9AGAM|nr:hypothetical protein FA95DRAFT_1485398 [Auriscalpium vulgare]